MKKIDLDYITKVLIYESGYSAEQAEAPAELLFSMTHTPNPNDGMMINSRRDLIEYIRYYL